MTFIYRIVFLISLICSGQRLIANTYYVKGNGNNASSGLSVTNAWRSIGKINTTTFSPGDSILFEGGTTFKGNITLGPDNAGTPEQPIFFGSYGSGKAIIFGGNSTGFYAYNTSGLEIKNLIFQGSGYTVNTGTGIYFFTDKTGNVKLKYVVLEDLEVSDFNVAGIRIGSAPTDLSRSGYDSVIIRNCITHDNGLSGLNIYGYYKTTDTFYSHKHVIISRCKAYNNFGISFMNEHSGSGIIVGQVDSCIMEYCEAYENGKNNNYAPAGPAGIWAWDSKNVTIQYCYSHHNRSQTIDGDGFDLDGGVRNSMMQGNYAHDNHGPGFLIAQYTGARKMENIIVRYNVSERDGKGLGALIWSGDPGSAVTAEKIDFYNNTIFIDTTGNSITSAAFAVYNNYGAMKNIRVCNNIFLTKNNATLIDIQRTLNLKFYNNAYYDYGDGFKFTDKGTTYNSLVIWRSVSGQEIYNGKNSGSKIDPEVINAGQGKSVNGVDSLNFLKAYRLKNTSALIGNGVIIDSLLGFKTIIRDFFGDTVFTNNQYSIGAHEIDAPKAQFSIGNNCVGTTSKFVNRSLKSIHYLWKFGDGSVSTLENPTHLYASPGLFSVTLIDTGKFGYIDSIKKTFEVYDIPKPNFTNDTVNNCPAINVVFNNTSTGAVSYIWKFEDSTTDNKTNTSHSFKKAGPHLVKLIATSGKNCKDSITKPVEVYEIPSAGFSLQNPCTIDSVYFTATGKDIAKCFWSFDNTLFSTLKTPANAYKNPGKYQVKLRVVSIHSCTDSFEKTIEIFRKPGAAFATKNHCFGDSIPLDNQSVNDSLIFWDFGNGIASVLKTPHIISQQTGIKNIKLKVISKNNCHDSVIMPVEIYPLPSALFTYKKVGDSFYFKAKDTLLKNYKWTVNSKLQSIKKPDLHVKFTTDGFQSVLLKAFNINNCNDTTSLSVDSKLSVPNIRFNQLFSIYPNPFSHNLTLQFNLNGAVLSEIKITDIAGRMLYKFDLTENNNGVCTFILNTDNYPLVSGVYNLECIINGYSMVNKIIKE